MPFGRFLEAPNSPYFLGGGMGRGSKVPGDLEFVPEFELGGRTVPNGGVGSWPVVEPSGGSFDAAGGKG